MHVRVGLMGIVGALAMTALAGCGEETPKAASTPAATAAATQAATAAATASATASAAASTPTLRVATAGGADVLVDAKGLTLYTFKNDEAAPGKSVCNAACATNWPPVVVASTATKDAALTGEVGTVTRDDGTKQATYRGKPLYRFAADTAPGETKGASIANWAVATPGGGASSTSDATPSASGTAASGSSEYNY